MNKLMIITAVGIMVFTSCTNQTSQRGDAALDSRLGLVEKDGEESHNISKTLEEIQEQNQQEQKRQLERQITDPLVQ